jgi:two-component system, sensor histidine kinase PdtaS
MANIATPFDAAQGLARALINASQQPMLLFDGDLKVVGASSSFCSAFGVPHDKADGRTLAEIGDGEWNFPQLRHLLENARDGGPDLGDYETDLRRAGAVPRQLHINAQNVVYGDAHDTLILLTISDVTNTRRVEEVNISLLLEKDSLLRERAILLQEMQHRIANSLQIIASVLMLKARAVKSEETRRHLRDAHDRVMSVAAVQRHLQESLGEVDLAVYLPKLCESLGSSMIRESRDLGLEVRADEATVSSHDAVSLGLIVTELVINALKHAYPDGRGGLILVEYRVGPTGWVLSVTDDGIGPPAKPLPTKLGLGTTVVRALAQQLAATVASANAAPGMTVTLTHTAPVAQAAPDVAPALAHG